MYNREQYNKPSYFVKVVFGFKHILFMIEHKDWSEQKKLCLAPLIVIVVLVKSQEFNGIM